MTSAEIQQKINFAIEPLPPLETLGNTWKRLDAAGHHSFFLTWAWIGTWLRCLPCSLQTMLLRARRDHETVGLAVLTLRRTTGRGMPIKQAWMNTTGDPAYDCITIEHNGFASANVGSDDLWTAFEGWFAAGVPAVDEIILNGVNVGAALPKFTTSAIERAEYGYYVPLANCRTLEGFISSLSRNSRQQLRRSLRAYSRKAPLSIEVARDTHTALAFFAQLKALHISSWTRRGRRHAFRNPFFETFHRSLIRRYAADGAVELMRVSAGDRVIGCLYNFVCHGVVSNYQTGFDDADRRLRPGYVCHALAITHYAAAGMPSYDFLGGTNRLKHSFGHERYKLLSYRLRKKTSVFRSNILTRRRAPIDDDAFEVP